MKITIQSHEEPNTVVLNRAAIDQLTRGNIIDAPITLLQEDPPIWILPTAMQQNGEIYLSHTLLKGDLTDIENAEYSIINEHLLFDIPPHLTNCGRHWITNLLHVDGGVLAFLHSEYTGPDDYFGMPGAMIDGVDTKAPGASRIGLAWLPQEELASGRYQFSYLGHIASYCSDIPHFNVSGTPVFVNESDGVEYVNILFSDVKTSKSNDDWTKEQVYVSHARSPLTDVIESAKAGTLTPWKKRDGSEWSDSLGQRSSGVLPNVDGFDDERIATGEIIVHSDIVKHRPSGKFILVGYVLHQKRRYPSCLVVYSSDDGLEWTFETTSHERTDCKSGWSYVTLPHHRLDENQGLYALIGWEYGKDGRSVYRLDIDISDF